MSENVDIKFSELRILIVIPLIAGILLLWVNANRISISKAKPPGIADISIKRNDNGQYTGNVKIDHRLTSPAHTIINSSSLAELQRCPGISKKTAKRILNERKFKKFFDWRDLKDRVKGIGDRQVEALTDAGVRLK